MDNEIYIVRFDALIKFVWIDDQERFVDANSWNAAIEKAAEVAYQICTNDIYVKEVGLTKKCAAEIRMLKKVSSSSYFSSSIAEDLGIFIFIFCGSPRFSGREKIFTNFVLKFSLGAGVKKTFFPEASKMFFKASIASIVASSADGSPAISILELESMSFFMVSWAVVIYSFLTYYMLPIKFVF